MAAELCIAEHALMHFALHTAFAHLDRTVEGDSSGRIPPALHHLCSLNSGWLLILLYLGWLLGKERFPA